MDAIHLASYLKLEMLEKKLQIGFIKLTYETFSSHPCTFRIKVYQK